MTRLWNSNREREGEEIENQEINTDKKYVPFVKIDRPFFFHETFYSYSSNTFLNVLEY